MKKIILLATIIAFAFAVRAGDTTTSANQAKDKSGCCAAKMSTQADTSGCTLKVSTEAEKSAGCGTKVSTQADKSGCTLKVSTQAEKSGCCATKVSTQADKSDCPMAKTTQTGSGCPFAKQASAKHSTVRTALQSPKAAAAD